MTKHNFPIKFNSKIGKLEMLLGMHYIEIPATIVKKLGGKFNIRLICNINKKLSFQCGIVALGEGKGYISLNAARMKKLGLKIHDKIEIELSKDESKYGMKVPEELEELLKQDKEGNRRFQNLTPGKQRYIIQYVGTVKSSQLRIDKAIMLIENLKKLKEGKESFREILGYE